MQIETARQIVTAASARVEAAGSTDDPGA
jgi:hypothetical protein